MLSPEAYASLTRDLPDDPAAVAKRKAAGLAALTAAAGHLRDLNDDRGPREIVAALMGAAEEFATEFRRRRAGIVMPPRGVA